MWWKYTMNVKEIHHDCVHTPHEMCPYTTWNVFIYHRNITLMNYTKRDWTSGSWWIDVCCIDELMYAVLLIDVLMNWCTDVCWLDAVVCWLTDLLIVVLMNCVCWLTWLMNWWLVFIVCYMNWTCICIPYLIVCWWLRLVVFFSWNFVFLCFVVNNPLCCLSWYQKYWIVVFFSPKYYFFSPKYFWKTICFVTSLYP